MIPFTVTFLLPYQIKQIICVMSPEDIPELEGNCFSIAKVICSFNNRYNLWLFRSYLLEPNLL
jgi:hypothetical protein